MKPDHFRKYFSIENPPLLVLPGCMLTFIIRPIAIIEESIELSPLLINGSGSPVFGNINVTTEIFVNTWNMNIAATPAAISFPKIIL